MSLVDVRDEFLAARAAKGDGKAFAELAHRYRRVIGITIRSTGFGGIWEDERQEALIGLYLACRAYRPTRGRFGPFAAVCIRHRVWNLRAHARRPSQRALTNAVALHESPDGGRPLTERLPAPESSDPAVVIDLREELRERAHRERARQANRRPRYTPEEINRALALVAEGKTLREAAEAVGTRSDRVSVWVKRAGQSPNGPSGQRYTPAQINHALALIEAGASLRQAGRAVGARDSTVLRWLRKAA
jgi:DNA-directed RNA polymerase specialized sigma24 family protein